jgi:hypothetical protein
MVKRPSLGCAVGKGAGQWQAGRMSEVTEYGLLMSGGGFHVRNPSPEVERIYPVQEWAAAEIRSGGHVYRRKVIVTVEWEEVVLYDLDVPPGKAKGYSWRAPGNMIPRWTDGPA